MPELHCNPSSEQSACVNIQLAFASCSLQSGKRFGRLWPTGSQLLDCGSSGSVFSDVDCIGRLLKDGDPWLPRHMSYLHVTKAT